MRLIIFGSTGTIGKHLVTQALAQGHTVKAFARNPNVLEVEDKNLTLVSGNVFDKQAVKKAIQGCEGVLITLGSAKLTGYVRSIGTENIVQAMEDEGVRRLVCQTTLGIGDSRRNLNFFWKYIMFGVILRAVFNDHVVQEKIVKQSTLDWVVVRPSSFTDALQTNALQYGVLPAESKLTLKVTREDVAKFMLKQLVSNKYVHQTPGLSN